MQTETKNLSELQKRTGEMLTAMFTENTGKSFLDSGDAYGRNWERNQGLTLASFLEMPEATWTRDWYTKISAWHYLNARLEYTKTAEVLTRLMNVWELSDYDNRNLYALGDQEAFLEHLGATVGDGWNTYNWETSLSQDLQGYDFELMGLRFVLLQVHGGCDARGGYTMPKIFEVQSDYWACQMDEYSLYCKNLECDFVLEVRGYDREAYHGESRSQDYDLPEGYGEGQGCPKCQSDFEVELGEPIDY